MKIRQDYKLKPDYINLENGYYCFTPTPILERYQKHIREVNYQGSWYMRTVQWENKDKVAARLAAHFGGTSDEVAITRNATESLDIIISGYPWKKGDEAIFAEQDYGSIQNMFTLAARRHGIVNKIVSVPNHPESDEEIVKIYEDAITSNTRLIMVSHMVNITGQILPVKKICDMAHKHGVEVMLDGAHCIAHFEFKINDLNCDYYACSLHKWLSVPLGAGLLYVKKEKIEKIWPMMAPFELDHQNIKNLNHIGTHPVATDLAINDALDYYEFLGARRKEERLRYLQRYWTDQVRNIPRIILNTPENPIRSCGIANVGITEIRPTDLAKILLDKYQIFTVGIESAGVMGCRITPNVYTTTAELDKFVSALKAIAKG
jgi:selenocysteine lyase/cysteine desulfurase